MSSFLPAASASKVALAFILSSNVSAQSKLCISTSNNTIKRHPLTSSSFPLYCAGSLWFVLHKATSKASVETPAGLVLAPRIQVA